MVEIRGGRYAEYITNLRCLVPSGKLNIIIDGQFGSTGKGLVSNYLGWWNNIDMAITNASMNAGHTFYIDGVKHITKHLPVSGILNKKSIIYLCAGAIINPAFLIKEIKTFNISKDRIVIHPRASIIEKQDIIFEQDGAVKKIASTRSGVGSALSRKINRSAKLAQDNNLLSSMVNEIDVNNYLDQGNTVIMEVPQGFDLSINSGLSYPHCTSREITVSSALSDAQVHPSYLGKVIVVIRTFPIRVGHIIEKDKIVGDSGPFYPDSKELSWKEIGVSPEMTTNTKRIRRVSTFSMTQYKKMLSILRPDYIFLNFANYLSNEDLKKLVDKLPEVTHVCYGPQIENIEKIELRT